MESKLYYQPVLSESEWIHGRLHSFEVYGSYQNAKQDYPNKIIAAYSGDDIEDPTYVDEPVRKYDMLCDIGFSVQSDSKEPTNADIIRGLVRRVNLLMLNPDEIQEAVGVCDIVENQ